MALNYQGALLLGFQIFFIVLGTVAIALRLVAKRIRDRPLQAHDVCCFLTYLFMVAYAVIYCVAPFYGLGQHVTTLTEFQLTTVLKLFFSSEYMYNTAVIFMRLSILLLYLTIFPNQRFRWFAYGLGSFIILFPSISMLYLFGFCIPIEKNWAPLTPGNCGNTLAVELVSGAVNLVLDMVLIAMPMPFIWRLQMPTQRKIAVSSVFCLGIINVGINIGRIVQPLVTDFADFTYSTPGAAILVTAEILTDLLISCVPTLGPVFKPGQFRNKYQPWYSSRGKRNTTTFDSEQSKKADWRTWGRLGGSMPSNGTSVDTDPVTETEMRRLYSVENLPKTHARAASTFKTGGESMNAAAPGQEHNIQVQVDLDVYESQWTGTAQS